MPTIDRHAPGDFCWFELATTDQAAAKQFYNSLFGWSVNDFPMGPNGSYSVFDMAGQSVAAAYTMRAEDRAKGYPPFWMLYVSTASADQTAKRASELGGNLLGPPFDVSTLGRMAVIADPTGAMFSIWEARDNPGVGVTGSDGTVCWADLSSPDPEKASQFYRGLFGWTIAPGEHDTSGYLHIQNGNTFIGGVPPASMRNPQAPPHWMLYFQVSNCDESAAKAQELGARAIMPPHSLEHVGRFAILNDPQGALFALFQPESR